MMHVKISPISGPRSAAQASFIIIPFQFCDPIHRTQRPLARRSFALSSGGSDARDRVVSRETISRSNKKRQTRAALAAEASSRDRRGPALRALRPLPAGAALHAWARSAMACQARHGRRAGLLTLRLRAASVHCARQAPAPCSRRPRMYRRPGGNPTRPLDVLSERSASPSVRGRGRMSLPEWLVGCF